MRARAHGATVEEKAEAWDRVMAATGHRAIALALLRVRLRDTVEAREAAEGVADAEGSLGVDAENVIQLRVVNDQAADR